MRIESRAYARRKLAGPALALIIVCSISMGLLVLATLFDVWLLSRAVGEAPEAPRRNDPFPKDVTIVVRMGWSCMIVITNIVILIGAVQMKNLRGRGFAWTTCILALIPCLGPCFILGIPFGIWGIVNLMDERVARAFR